jgi:hypothetical protein
LPSSASDGNFAVLHGLLFVANWLTIFTLRHLYDSQGIMDIASAVAA